MKNFFILATVLLMISCGDEKKEEPQATVVQDNLGRYVYLEPVREGRLYFMYTHSKPGCPRIANAVERIEVCDFFDRDAHRQIYFDTLFCSECITDRQYEDIMKYK